MMPPGLAARPAARAAPRRVVYLSVRSGRGRVFGVAGRPPVRAIRCVRSRGPAAVRPAFAVGRQVSARLAGSSGLWAVRPRRAAGTRAGHRGRAALRAGEPHQADDGQHGRDVEVEAQAEEVLRGIDPDRLLEDPERRVPGHVQGEQAPRADPPVVAQPDQQGGEGQVPDDLVQERRLEGPVAEVPGRPVGRGDLQTQGSVVGFPNSS